MTEIMLPAELEEQRTEMEFLAESLTVADEQGMTRARTIIHDLKAVQKKIVSVCDQFVKPMKSAYDEARKSKKAFVEPLEMAEKIIRGKLNTYANHLAAEEEATRIEIAKAAQADVRDIEVPSKVSKGFREDTVYEIVNIDEVPRLFCTPDMKKIKAYFVQYADGEIPGVAVKKVKRAVV